MRVVSLVATMFRNICNTVDLVARKIYHLFDEDPDILITFPCGEGEDKKPNLPIYEVVQGFSDETPIYYVSLPMLATILGRSYSYARRRVIKHEVEPSVYIRFPGRDKVRGYEVDDLFYNGILDKASYSISIDDKKYEARVSDPFINMKKEI